MVKAVALWGSFLTSLWIDLVPLAAPSGLTSRWQGAEKENGGVPMDSFWNAIAMGLSGAVLPLTGCERPLNVKAKAKGSLESVNVSDELKLPPPARRGQLSLEEALARRRSHRAFTGKPLTTEMLSQLLWAAAGITDREGYRTAPSAGALYPLEIYLATAAGFYHYEPRGHRLMTRLERDVRRDIYRAALEQDAVVDAPAVLVVTAVYARTAAKYGGARAERYVHLEAGHAAQNVLLQAVSLDLGAVPIGAFHDDRLLRALDLPRDHHPVYLIPVGHPR
jgi:SagB-type dehydrogenase family enzyme